MHDKSGSAPWMLYSRPDGVLVTSSRGLSTTMAGQHAGRDTRSSGRLTPACWKRAMRTDEARGARIGLWVPLLHRLIDIGFSAASLVLGCARAAAFGKRCT